MRLPPQRAQVPQREVSSGKQGAWLLSESHTLERLTDVLEERAAELAELGLNNDAYLPFAQQKKVQERLRRIAASPSSRKHARRSQSFQSWMLQNRIPQPPRT